MKKPSTCVNRWRARVDLVGTYSNRTDLREAFAELVKHIQGSGPRNLEPPKPRTSGGRRKHLTPKEAAEIVSKYEAGVSMARLKAEHHMAKRTVAKVLRAAGVTIRPRGGQHHRGIDSADNVLYTRSGR
jgi:hypothetical protein